MVVRGGGDGGIEMVSGRECKCESKCRCMRASERKGGGGGGSSGLGGNGSWW